MHTSTAPISDAQIETLRYVAECGIPPTLAEIAHELGISARGAQDRLIKLKQGGYITREFAKARTARVTEAGLDVLRVFRCNT